MQGITPHAEAIGGHFAVLTQGFPQLVRLSPDVVHADDSRSFGERSPVLCQVRMVNEYPLVPDFERLERQIAEETRSARPSAGRPHSACSTASAAMPGRLGPQHARPEAHRREARAHGGRESPPSSSPPSGPISSSTLEPPCWRARRATPSPSGASTSRWTSPRGPSR